MSTPQELLQQHLRDFARERDWEQFHTPKNVAMALAGEVGELLAELQWLSDDDVKRQLESDADFRSRIEQEMAYLHLYLLRLADLCGSDIIEVSHAKIEVNASKYPPEKARGTSTKYTRLSWKNKLSTARPTARH